jgi:hypothetical protein
MSMTITKNAFLAARLAIYERLPANAPQSQKDIFTTMEYKGKTFGWLGAHKITFTTSTDASQVTNCTVWLSGEEAWIRKTYWKMRSVSLHYGLQPLGIPHDMATTPRHVQISVTKRLKKASPEEQGLIRNVRSILDHAAGKTQNPQNLHLA